MATINSPWDHPEPRGLSVVQGVLRVIVAVQCWGSAAERFQERSLSDAAWLLFRGLTDTSPEALQFDRIMGFVLLAAGMLTLIRPVWVVLIPVTAWFGLQAAASTVAAGSGWNAFAPAEQLVRVAAPLALLFIDWWPPKLKFSLGRFLFGLGSLRMAAVISLAAQGFRTLISVPDRDVYIDLLRRCVTALHQPEWTSERASMALGVLGGIDIGMALALWTTRSRAVAAVVGSWGLLRISLWTLALGPDGYPQTLSRIAMAGAPFVLAVFSLLAVKEHAPEILPAARASK